MPNQEIIDWVTNAQKQGYSPEQLRGILRQHGFGLVEIEEALRTTQPPTPADAVVAAAATTQTAPASETLPAKRRMPWQMILGFVLLGLAGVLFIVYLFI